MAAGTLDASTKIYAYRVDSVYGDTLKIAGGLGQAGKQDAGDREAGAGGEGGEDGEANPDQPKKKRRTKKSTTVEKNLKNINVNKFELEFDVDPLFKKTSSQFDSSSGGNQFLATLQVMNDMGVTLFTSNSTRKVGGPRFLGTLRRNLGTLARFLGRVPRNLTPPKIEEGQLPG